jgi:hypothetical protein
MECLLDGDKKKKVKKKNGLEYVIDIVDVY